MPPSPRPLRRDPDEDERRRAELEDSEETALHAHTQLELIAERASLSFSHPAVHRLARRQRARHAGLGREESA